MTGKSIQIKKYIFCMAALLLCLSGGGKTVQAAVGQDIVDCARTYIGKVKYVYGGNSLQTGVDCSGFVCCIYERYGVNLWNNRPCLEKEGQSIGTDITRAQPGDIVCFEGHYGIYSGNGRIIHAINENYGVGETTVEWMNRPVLAIVRVADGIKTANSAQAADNPGRPYPVPVGLLSSGSVGDTVRWVQSCLNALQGAGLDVDGIYGPGTAAAVIQFQKAYGLAADGIVGSLTTAKMLELWRKNPGTPGTGTGSTATGGTATGAGDNTGTSGGNIKKGQEIKVPKAVLTVQKKKKKAVLKFSTKKSIKGKVYYELRWGKKKAAKKKIASGRKKYVFVYKKWKKGKYYFRVRAYQYDAQGKKVYGAYSKTKKLVRPKK